MIFIVGNSRSGTTMLGRMLGNNSSVNLFPELHLFGPCIAHGKELAPISKEESIKIFTWLVDVYANGFHAKRNPTLYLTEGSKMADSFYKSGVDAWDAYHYFVEQITIKNGKIIPCEDMPGNIFKLPQLFKKFPTCKVIHIVRDPRDVVLSQKNRHQRRKMGGHYVTRKESLRFWANYHPYFISRLWKNAVSSAIVFENHPNILTIKFEDLLLQTEETLKSICKHCDLTYETSMQMVPQVGSSSQKDNPTKLGVDEERVGAWQRGGLNAGEIELCERITANELRHFGYTPSNTKVNLFVRLYYILLLPIKGVFALLLNWGRTKGIINFIKNRILK
ncbi:MAG: sulfotransferase family protein [Bacteroidota bacterium]